LRDLYLEYKGLTAQIDYVVIDTKFILIIECKKMTGDIQVNNNGDFIRLFKNVAGKVYKKEGIYSPIVQNERHVELIKRILIDEMKSMTEKKCKNFLRSIIVFANPKTIVNMKYAKADTKKSIIRCDQLIAHMKDLHAMNKDGTWFAEDGMYRVAEILMSYHKENVVDYTQKYGLTSQVNQPHKVEEEQAPPTSTSSVPIEETPIYKELREYRLTKSREEKIKAYYIYNNAQLEQIIAEMPETYGKLMQIKGFGDKNCSKYGNAIIDIVKKYK
jgi:superfamily II DNA helicase RecQ